MDSVTGKGGGDNLGSLAYMVSAGRDVLCQRKRIAGGTGIRKINGTNGKCMGNPLLGTFAADGGATPVRR